LVALLIFIAGFAITIRVLLRDRPEQQSTIQPEQQQRVEENTDKIASAPRNRNRDSDPVDEAEPIETSAVSPVTLATVTVTIDPNTGLLATPNCPLRTKMTYPTGSEPRGHCNLSHAPPPKESTIKSIAKRVRSLE
jgi:hypothetical protein